MRLSEPNLLPPCSALTNEKALQGVGSNSSVLGLPSFDILEPLAIEVLFLVMLAINWSVVNTVIKYWKKISMNIELKCGPDCWNIDPLNRAAAKISRQEQVASDAGLAVTPGEITCQDMERRRCSDTCESGPRICGAVASRSVVILEGQTRDQPENPSREIASAIEGFVPVLGQHEHNIPLHRSDRVEDVSPTP